MCTVHFHLVIFPLASDTVILSFGVGGLTEECIVLLQPVIWLTIITVLSRVVCIGCGWWLMVFNATFTNISVISWRSVLLVKETGVPGENRRPVASHGQILSHNVISSTSRHQQYLNSQR